jgi:hypothetical protein
MEKNQNYSGIIKGVYLIYLFKNNNNYAEEPTFFVWLARKLKI